MTKHRAIFILFAYAAQILFVSGLIGAAQAGDIFSVDKIAVEATANTSAEARGLALLRGQRTGLMTVLRKLTQEQNWAELPDPQLIDPEPYVLGFRVSDEKSSPRKYEAKLNVSFNPESLRSFLRERGLSVSEVQAPIILLLPILEDQFDVRLWTENWWRSLWANQDLNNITTPFMLPLGDIGDTATAGENDILLGDRLKIDLLKHRYGVDTALVVHALADIDGQLGVTVMRMFDPPAVQGWAVVVLGSVALVVDTLTAWLTYSMQKGSVNIRALFLHNLSDALASVAVIVGGTLILLYEASWADPAITMRV